VAKGSAAPSITAATICTVDLPATAASPAPPVSIQHPMYQLFDGRVALLGYDLPQAEYRAGHTIHLDLYWEAVVGPTANYQVVLSLTDATGQALARSASALPDAPAASLVRAQYALTVPGRASGQRCSLNIEVRDAATDLVLEPIRVRTPFQGGPLQIGHVLIREEQRLFSPPAIQYPRSAVLGDKIELLGYSLENASLTPGDAVAFTLYWRALRDIQHSYTVFVHLVDQEARVWAQGDGLPYGGERPTSGWIQGEIIVDERRVALDQDTPPGQYALECGMYDATTGARLPLYSDTGERLPEDAIVLQQISVTD
jgi:hypothetical protein